MRNSKAKMKFLQSTWEQLEFAQVLCEEIDTQVLDLFVENFGVQNILNWWLEGFDKSEIIVAVNENVQILIADQKELGE